MNLNELFNNAPDVEIEQLSSDSRMPMKNAIFFCLDGIKYNGHKFVNEAIDNGAVAIVYSEDINIDRNVVYIKVKNVNETLFKIADQFYNHPNEGIDKYLVSGCYGRSSVSSIIKYYLDSKNNCGYVGVFGINIKDKHLSTSFPALTPLENIKVLDNLKKESISNCVFEASPISLYYKKLDVIKIDVFVYTNTSEYSSDYISCNNNYFDYLRKYLYTLENNTFVVLNCDDIAYDELNDSNENIVTYGSSELADYRIDDLKYAYNSLEFKLYFENQEYEVNSKLVGRCNAFNITAAIAALHSKGYEIQDIIDCISNMECIDGVMEYIDDSYNIVIDSACENDSLSEIMSFYKQITNGKLIGVFAINYSYGEKTVESFANIAEKYLDRIILTEDESRESEVMSILSRVDKYISSNKTIKIPFRSLAIENAINIMSEDDTVLILGKGNENYLSMGLGKERYLGDKHYALKAIKSRKSELEID